VTSFVLERYDELKASGKGHVVACRIIGRDLGIDDATISRVVGRAEKAAGRPTPFRDIRLPERTTDR
jgi:hypothetical protein